VDDWKTRRKHPGNQTALELDPLSINYNDALEFEFLLARRYDEAIEQAAKILELDPNLHFGLLRSWRGICQKIHVQGSDGRI